MLASMGSLERGALGPVRVEARVPAPTIAFLQRTERVSVSFAIQPGVDLGDVVVP